MKKTAPPEMLEEAHRKLGIYVARKELISNALTTAASDLKNWKNGFSAQRLHCQNYLRHSSGSTEDSSGGVFGVGHRPRINPSRAKIKIVEAIKAFRDDEDSSNLSKASRKESDILMVHL